MTTTANKTAAKPTPDEEFATLTAIPISERTAAQNRRVRTLAGKLTNTSEGQAERSASQKAHATKVQKGSAGLFPGGAAKATKSTAAGGGIAAKPTPARRSAAAKRNAVPGDFPGLDKAARLTTTAGETGWTADVRTEGPSTLAVTVRRGDASITVTFTDGKLDLGRMPSYVRAADAKPVKLKNVSAALAVMAVPAQ